MEAEVIKAKKKLVDAQLVGTRAENDFKKGKLDRFKALDAQAPIGEAKEELSRVTSARDALSEEWKKSNAPKILERWNEVKKLRDYRDSLTNTSSLSDPDPKKSLKALKSYERLTTGDLTELPGARGYPVRNPPLLRLLHIGFFNPKGNFDLDFFKEMAHDGFLAGAMWPAPDYMHFELVEGRHSIYDPGTKDKEGKLVE